MKFSEIKAGDKVLVQIKMSYGWSSGLYYYVRRTVVRTTSTQFILKDGNTESKYYKEDGRKVGGGERAFAMSEVGSKINSYQTLTDDTEKFIEDKSKVKMVQEITKHTEKINVNNAPQMVAQSMSDLEALLALVKKIAPIEEKTSA